MRIFLSRIPKIATLVFCMCLCLPMVAQINTNIITANASGCEGLTNYSSGGENHRIYYYPGSSTSTSQTPATLTATSPSGAPVTFVWMKFVVDLNIPRNGWQQVQVDQNVTNSNLSNQGIGAYLVYVYDASGNFIDYDLCWVLITRLQPSQMPSAVINNSTSDCDGPNTINGLTTGTASGLIIAPANTPYSYAEPPTLPLMVNANSTISVNFIATQPNTLASLVFAIEGPITCNSPIVYLGSVAGFSPAVGSTAATGTFNPANCTNPSTAFDFTFSNVPGSIYNACDITTGADLSTGIYYANPSGTANPTPDVYDFNPLMGCDASNGGWKFRVWECGTGGGNTSITDMTASISGGYSGPSGVTSQVIIGLVAPSPAAAVPNGNSSNCGQLTSGLTTTVPQTSITPESCTANGYAWHTDPEFILPANAIGNINSGTQPQSLVLNNPLSDASGPLTYWQDFEVTLTITNVCHQEGIDNGCFGSSLQDVQTVSLTPTTSPTLTAIPPLCVTAAAEELIADVPGEWTGNGVELSGTSYVFNPNISGVGIHTLTFHPDNPCYSVESIDVQVDDTGTDLPNFVIPANTGYCLNAPLVNLSSFVSEPGTFGGPGVDSNTGYFDASLNFPGPVTITFIPENGCPDAVLQNVTVYPLPSIVIAQTSSINFCEGSSITLDASGANAYNWSVSSGSANIQTPNGSSTLITPTATSTIIVEGTENINNCSNTTTVQLIQYANEIPSINSSQSFCENSPSLLLEAQLANGLMPSNGTWSGAGVNGNEFVAASANLGINTITFDLPDNPAAGYCYSPATVDFIVNPIPTFSNTTSGDATICAGSNHAMNAAINEPGTTTFQWNPITGLNDPNIASPTTTLNSSETYEVTAINSGCSATETITITVLPVETPVITSVDTFCTNGVAYTFQATIPGGTWTSNPVNAGLTNTGNFNPAISASGNYVITYTPTGQCQLPSDIQAVVADSPTANAGPDATVCVNATPFSTMQGSSTNSVSHTWSPSSYLTNSSSLTTTINATASGVQQYTLTVTGPGGCIATDVVAITFQNIFTPTIDPLGPFCTTDAQSVLSANSLGGTWYIDGVILPSGLITPSLINSSSVMVTYDPGTTCSNIAEQEVFFSDPADFVFAPVSDYCIYDNSINLIDSIDFNATFDNVDGVISDPFLGTFDPAVAGAGTYNIICQVNDVCVLTLNYNVTVHAPVIDVSDEQICFNIDTVLQAPVENPAGVYTYQWSPATFLNDATLDAPIITFSDTLNYPTGITYSVTGTDAYGCEFTDQKHVTVYPAPYVTTSPQTIICPFEEIILSAVGTAGTFSWSPAADIISDGTTPNPTISTSATTIFTVTLSDINCPDITAEAHVTVPTEPLYNIDAGPDTFFCEYTSIYINANPGGANPDFVWSTADGLLGDDSLSTQIHVANEGTYTFHVTTPLGCTYSDDVFVNEVLLPIGMAPDTSFLCLGDTLILNPGVWDSVSWDIGLTANTLAVTSPGIYPHEIHQDGCSSRDTFLVAQVVLPYFDLGPDRKVCTGDTIFIAAEIAGEWNTGVIDSVLTVTEGGDYVMSVSLGSCIRFDSIYVDEIPLPTCNLPNEVIGCKGEGTVLDAFAPDIDRYYWSTGDTSSSILVFDVDDYYVRIFNYCGSALYSTHAGLEICSNTIFIPNSFTPDGDNINDYWRVYANNIQSINITISNRYGEVVFKSDDAEKSWLGDKNEGGYYLDDGVYFYTIIFKDENGDNQKMVGSINLMR